jgi:hypothetical protein
MIACEIVRTKSQEPVRSARLRTRRTPGHTPTA